MVECLFPRRRILARYAGADSDLSRRASPGGQHAQCTARAMVATLLWWLVDVLFGIFMCGRVPYSVVYGGLAAVIGLIIWNAAFRGNHFSWCRMER